MNAQVNAIGRRPFWTRLRLYQKLILVVAALACVLFSAPPVRRGADLLLHGPRARFRLVSSQQNQDGTCSWRWQVTANTEISFADEVRMEYAKGGHTTSEGRLSLTGGRNFYIEVDIELREGQQHFYNETVGAETLLWIPFINLKKTRTNSTRNSMSLNVPAGASVGQVSAEKDRKLARTESAELVRLVIEADGAPHTTVSFTLKPRFPQEESAPRLNIAPDRSSKVRPGALSGPAIPRRAGLHLAPARGAQ